VLSDHIVSKQVAPDTFRRRPDRTLYVPDTGAPSRLTLTDPLLSEGAWVCHRRVAGFTGQNHLAHHEYASDPFANRQGDWPITESDYGGCGSKAVVIGADRILFWPRITPELSSAVKELKCLHERITVLKDRAAQITPSFGVSSNDMFAESDLFHCLGKLYIAS
jgi:hypothetical protein